MSDSGDARRPGASGQDCIGVPPPVHRRAARRYHPGLAGVGRKAMYPGRGGGRTRQLTCSGYTEKGACSLLLDRLARFIPDRSVLNLLGQYMRRTAERGGCFHDHVRGISLGWG